MNVSENPFVTLWRQTRVLFTNENAKKMTIVCLMQCGLFGSCHGLYMFFPEIVDKLATYSHQYPDGRSTICQVMEVEGVLMGNATMLSVAAKPIEECSEQFEVSTFFHSLIMEMLYMVGFLIITFIINRTSKLNILLVITFGCSISGFASLFVNIPLLSVYIYVMFMLLFLAVNVVNAAIVDLFPTNLRYVTLFSSILFFFPSILFDSLRELIFN